MSLELRENIAQNSVSKPFWLLEKPAFIPMAETGTEAQLIFRLQA